MRLDKVDSTTLSAIGHDPVTLELDLKFRDTGDVYRYSDVSAAEHAEFMAAPSKGTYLNCVFKAKNHRYVLLRSGKGRA